MKSKMIAASSSEITQLSAAERVQLAQDIWDSVADSPDAVRLSDAQTQELDQRLESYRENPQRGSSWRDVQQRVQG